ncbi:MAG: hypothetical protein AAB692_00690 [Patescibacteria group bacterium]
MGTTVPFRSDADLFIDEIAKKDPAFAAIKSLLPSSMDQDGLRIRCLFADLLEVLPPIKGITLPEAVAILSETDAQQEIRRFEEDLETNALYENCREILERDETDEVRTSLRSFAGMAARLYRASREKADT